MAAVTIPTLPVNGPIQPFPLFTGSFDPSIRPIAPIIARQGMRPNYANSHCLRLHGVGLATNNTFKNRRALVSYPKSGGAWLSRLIQALTGFYVDSIKGFAYMDHNDCGCTILTETHDTKFTIDNSTALDTLFRGNGVLMIRNPFRTILSNRVRDARKVYKANLYPAFTKESGWGEFVSTNIERWEKLVTTWTRGLKRGGVICYEHVETNPEKELLRLVSILGLPSVDKKRLECVLEHEAKQFLTPSTNLRYPTDPFTLCQKKRVAESIDRVQLELRERKLNPLPTEFYEFYIPFNELRHLDCSNLY